MDNTNNSSQYEHHNRCINSSAYTEEESEELLELTTMDLYDEPLTKSETSCVPSLFLLVIVFR